MVHGFILLAQRIIYNEDFKGSLQEQYPCQHLQLFVLSFLYLFSFDPNLVLVSINLNLQKKKTKN